MASTPSPTAVELPTTPPAPRYGGYLDNWEPYQPRKSARLASQSSSPKDKSNSPTRSTKPKGKASSSARMNSTGYESKGARNPSKSTIAQPSEMLLTPKKTPRKPETVKEAADIDPVSRDIFRSASNRTARVPKKISGSTLESFSAEEPLQDFDIYNDTCNRIPQKDESNPFYNPTPEPKKRPHKDKKVKIPGEGSRSYEQAAGRDDGMLMNFRGKTIYRHFAKPGNTDSEEPDELATDAEGNSHQPLSAKQVKPKLLWPKESAQDNTDSADEEAATDVEDMNVGESESPPATPARKGKTPNAPKFLSSPPTTQRTTRATDKLGAGASPVASSRRAQPVLNYNKWGSVAKSHKSSVTPAKRSGEPLSQDRPKRSRTPNDAGH